MSIYTVILAGGSGTRLWPLSRISKPKQFLRFCNEGTMLQKAFKRNQFANGQKTYFVTNVEHICLINEQLQEAAAENFTLIIEPEPKNTAPAVIAAALDIFASDPEAIMIVAPSDNEIKNTDYYRAKVLQATELALQGYYVTFGVTPTRPEIAYGYLKKGRQISFGSHMVERFVEKPNINKACEYLASENYFWNSGIFVLPVARLVKEMALLEPKMFAYVKSSLEDAKIDGHNTFLAKEPFSLIHGNSIDYALMEKTGSIAFVEYNSPWSDMGTWYSVWENQEKDDNGNVLSSNAIALNTKNSFISSNSGKLIATLGLENISIIETPDVLLVTNSGSSHNVKDIVTQLSAMQSPELTHHTIVQKSWGTFENLKKGSNFLIKKIIVKPGQKLSLQYHNHRSAHWVVTKGVAEVIVDGEVTILEENDYVFIPPMAKHKLANLALEDLELIEVQFGSTLEESDIVKLEDEYNKVA